MKLLTVENLAYARMMKGLEVHPIEKMDISDLFVEVFEIEIYYGQYDLDVQLDENVKKIFSITVKHEGYQITLELLSPIRYVSNSPKDLEIGLCEELLRFDLIDRVTIK